MRHVLDKPRIKNLRLLGIGAESISERSSWLGPEIASVRPCEDETAVIDYAEDQEARTFLACVERWRKETGMLSSWSKKVQHPAYRAIIALGMKAVPLILRELRDRPAHWFEALTSITGQTPIPASDRADPKKAREAWLHWGRERGLIE